MSTRHWEQPETYIATTSEEELRRQFFIQNKNEFLAGTMDPELVSYLRKSNDAYFKQWELQKQFAETSKVKQAVRLKKYKTRVWNMLKAGANKSEGCKRYRIAKPVGVKKYTKLKKQFLKETGKGETGWRDFVNHVCAEKGARHMFLD